MVQYKEQLSVKIQKWIYDEAGIASAKNKTSRIEELMLKGYMYEQQQSSQIRNTPLSGTNPTIPSLIGMFPNKYENLI